MTRAISLLLLALLGQAQDKPRPWRIKGQFSEAYIPPVP